jgi:hypothetical protein
MVIVVVLAIVFGIGVSAIVLNTQEGVRSQPAAAGSPPASGGATPGSSSDLRPQQEANPADASAAARDKAESPTAPPDANAPQPKR